VLRLDSINVGRKTDLQQGERVVSTGIFKKPVTHAVQLSSQGITGDAICDRRHHGGVDQAIYIYRSEDYEWWNQNTPYEFGAGHFGENLTIRGIPGPGLLIGDQISFEDICLQVTAPRIPCATFAARIGNKQFVKEFNTAQRPGFYCRVVKAGILHNEAQGRLEVTDAASTSTLQFYRDLQRTLTLNELDSYLALPIDERSRKDFTARRVKLTDRQSGFGIKRS
jgi:MOSC domain-containing protein YiiM|tara:strand:- start:208 stop:879 length:672 start_codon:yes stop_codon:yes gene_type:complete